MRASANGLCVALWIATAAMACNDAQSGAVSVEAPRASADANGQAEGEAADEPGEGAGEEPLRAVCQPDRGPFSATIDNPYYPLPVGTRWLYEGVEEGERIGLRVTVLDETEVVAGVTTRVVEEYEEVDGKLAEISRNFFAQAPDGTVCYFGEDVDIYEDGRIASHEGAWRAGGANEPGVIMPGTPKVGMSFEQELAPGIAEDRSEITAIGGSITVPAGTYTDTVWALDTNPLDGSSSDKTYARGVGLVFDNGAELLRVERP